MKNHSFLLLLFFVLTIKVGFGFVDLADFMLEVVFMKTNLSVVVILDEIEAGIDFFVES